MFLEDQYRTYLKARDLAPNTIDNYVSSLRRLEREHNVDLEKEFGEDQFRSLIERLTYTREDEAASRPNPSNLAIEPSKLFSHLGWYRRVLERYKNFRLDGDTPIQDQTLIDDVADSETEEAAARTFKLEHDLQAALRENIRQLEDGMTIVDGGSEYQVEAGYIDILARDKSGQWVIIELKAGDARPDSIAQILSYMASVASEKNGDVRGILIAADFVPRVRLAAKAVPNLSLQKYKFNFLFEPIR